MAVGKLFGYEGNVIVIADGGPGFCSASPAAFDSFRAGNTVDGTSLHPICLRVNDFQAHYLPSGQATSFAADIDYQAGRDLSGRQLAALPAGGQPPAAGRRRPGVPAGPRLRADVHRDVPRRADPHARPCSGGPTTRRPCCRRGWRASTRRPAAIPTPPSAANTRSRSRVCWHRPSNSTAPCCRRGFPALNAPAVAVDIYRGDTGLDTGRPQSLFSLDPRLIDQGRLTKDKRVNLRAGQEVRIDQGPAAGTVVRFDGAVPFVNLQVSHDPGQIWVLVFAIAMMAGLLVSLLVRRRRVWVRLHAGRRSPGTVNVELGGLARTDNSGWGDEFERLDRALLTGLDESGGAAEAPASRRSSEVDVT